MNKRFLIFVYFLVFEFSLFGGVANGCHNVTEAAAMAILQQFPPTNQGITDALPGLKQAFGSQVEILYHAVRLDKIDFGDLNHNTTGMIVDVIADASLPTARWVWQVESPCGSSGPAPAPPPGPAPGPGGPPPGPGGPPGPAPTTVPPAPQILGIDPSTAKPGDKIAITGAFLGETIILQNSTTIQLTANLNAQKTRAEATLPANTPAGLYNITSLSGISGSHTVPNLLTVISSSPPPSLPQFPPAQNLGELVQNIFTWALWLVGAAMFFNFFWAGFLWFTAAGRTGPIGQAKEKMTNALIGAIVLLASYLILKTINPDLVQQTFTLPGL